MALLMRYRIPGTELDSSMRYPQPRCHLGTREALLTRIKAWLNSSERDHKMLWLYGPSGVGKSAVLQTVAEHCRDSISRLGAAVFFSRPYNANDPRRLFPTLARQLAVRYPAYKRLVCQRLIDDPMVLEQDLSTQFEELIARPFSFSRVRQELKGKLPLLMVLDGLDECEGSVAQVKILQLIGGYVDRTPNSPLLWMVSGRPEPHIQSFFSTIQSNIICRKEEMVLDNDGKNDVDLFLRDEFREMRLRHWDIFDPDEHWPSPVQMTVILQASSASFVFASILLRFVGDVATRDPKLRLSACLDFIEISSLSAPGNDALRPLDLLYTYILSDIPESAIPTAFRVLGFCAYYPNHPLSAQALSNFLFLDQAAFHQILRPLYSVVNVPEVPQATTDPLRFYYTSFGTFFKERERSGPWHIRVAMVHAEVATLSIRWLNHFIKYSCTLSRGKLRPL